MVNQTVQLKPEQISRIIRSQIKYYENAIEQTETGTVTMVGDGIARAAGLDNCMAGELVQFESGTYGMAQNLEENAVSIVMLGSDEGIRDPIRCCEYMGRFYVQEGNKRVSVLKSFGAPSIPAVVTRIIPAWSQEHEVRLCCYGHIHGKGCAAAFNGWRGGTEYKLVSADWVEFTPVKIIE